MTIGCTIILKTLLRVVVTFIDHIYDANNLFTREDIATS